MHSKYCVHGACSVAVSYKPPMLVTRARLPACAFVRLPKGGCCNSLESCLHTVSCCLMRVSRLQTEPTCNPKRYSGMRLTPPRLGHLARARPSYTGRPRPYLHATYWFQSVSVVSGTRIDCQGIVAAVGAFLLVVEADCNSIIGLGCNVRIRSM